MVQGKMWGMTLLPNKKYTRVVEESFRITSATFGVDLIEEKGRTVVQTVVDDNYYVIGSLVPKTNEQQLLDLEFYRGQEVTFFTTGLNNVYLAGNVLGLDGAEDSEDEELDSDEIEYMDEDEDDEDLDSEDDDYAEFMENLLGEGSEEDDSDDSESGPIIEELSSEEDVAPKANGKAKANGQPKAIPEPETKKNKKNKDTKEEDAPRKKVKTAPEADKKKENSPAKKEAAPKQEAQPKKEAAPKPAPSNIQKLPNGLILEDKVVGTGAVAVRGKKVNMRYIGKLTNGKVFDKNVNGRPFSFKLGVGEVIKGWDLGIVGMKVGGERKLTIPFNLAYGTRGAPPDIPPRAELIFEVKLVDVAKK